LFKPDQEKAAVDQMGKSKRKKRTAQTPLERISLEQLQLRAVIRAPSGNRALVEDNSGKGYIIKIGTYIGLNSGIVTQINADSVVIEEEIENLMGELVLQNTEIKLQKPTGE
jgi:type IV pilus assembly protein PilP